MNSTIQSVSFTASGPARVAQWIEYLASNQGVVGSIPTAGTIETEQRFLLMLQYTSILILGGVVRIT